jgi:CRISPR-associated protein Cas5d
MNEKQMVLVNSQGKNKKTVFVKVYGDFACFTTHESKGDRHSYPIMTPTAAAYILQNINYHYDMCYKVREIHVLNPIDSSFNTARKELQNIEQGNVSIIRQTNMLYDVAYNILADIYVDDDSHHKLMKFYSMFDKRMEDRKPRHDLYFGSREFRAYYSKPTENDVPLSINYDVGSMIHSWETIGNGVKIPRFFKAEIKNGIMKIPDSPALFEEKK